MNDKKIFDQSLDEMLEFDVGLDINSVFESIPAIETEPDKPDPDKVDEKEGGDKLSLKNINKVLDEQATKVVKDKEKVDEVVESTKDKNDEAPATIVQTTETISDAPFTVIFAKDLVAQGLLSSFDEKKFLDESKDLGEATALRNLIKGEIDANIEAAKSDLDLGYQEYLSLVGRGVPAETAGSLLDLKNKFDSIKTDDLIKEDNTDVRKSVMTDYFRLTTSMSDSKISKLVQSSVDLGDDIEDSKEYLGNLKELIRDQITAEETEAKQQLELRKEENRQTLESLKDNINSLNEIIPGVDINKQTKTKMFEDLTKEVQDGKGRITNAVWAKRAEDPIFFDSRLAYLYETGFFDKTKPWTKASQAKITKEVSELESAIKKNTLTNVGTPVIRSPEQDKTSRENIESMRGIFE